jgi:hypothetical protein
VSPERVIERKVRCEARIDGVIDGVASAGRRKQIIYGWKKRKFNSVDAQLLDDGKLGPITPAMKRLQEKYLAGRMNGQDFMFNVDIEVQKLAREREEQQNS